MGHSLRSGAVWGVPATLATPTLGFAAFSGTGKTTLLRRLIPLLRERGLHLGLLKHSHHAFEIDRPGKDSDVLRQAGAIRMLVTSARRTVLIIEQETEPTLAELLQRLDDKGLDLILMEGFKREPISKIELHRPSLGQSLLCLADPLIIAAAADAPLAATPAVPVLSLNDPAAIADFIERDFLPAWANLIGRAAPSAAAGAAIAPARADRGRGRTPAQGPPRRR